MHRLLLLTDTKVEALVSILQSSGYDVTEASSLPAIEDLFDLGLLHYGARPTECVEQIRTIRKTSDLPLVVVATEAGVAECVVALELGADEFIRQPVSELELLARLKAVLRRATSSSQPQAILSIDDIELYSESRVVRQAGRPLRLTAVEFDLLRLLLHSVGSLVTREVISAEVFQRRAHQCNRSIDVHMSSLRKKLGPRTNGLTNGDLSRIRTIRGYGYIYVT